MNLGAQVLVPDLVAQAREEKADAVLVSQVVTQRDAHLKNTREMSAAFREAYPTGKAPLLVSAGRASTSTRPGNSGSTGSSGGARRPARWPATSCTP